MTDALLDRIVDCAHYSKITSIDQLERETKWPHTQELGSHVLAFIQIHFPELVLISSRPSTPEPQSNRLNNILNTPTRRRQKKKAVPTTRKCGACELVGHTKANTRLCKMHPQYSGAPPTTQNISSQLATSSSTNPPVLILAPI